MMKMQKALTLNILATKEHTRWKWLEKVGIDASRASMIMAVGTMALMVAAYASIGLAIYYFQRRRRLPPRK